MTVIEEIRLVLVRHAMPVVDPAVPAERWQIGPDGQAAARTLRPLVVGPAYYVASTEPKAVQTLHEIAGDTGVTTDARLAEARRPHLWHAAAAAAQTRTLIVGTHGLAMTIWLASRCRLEPDPAQFWAALRFPDLIEADLSHGVIRRPGS
jgi:hypothetical protein